jgi:membrane protein DedA with SNARE-associated domain
VSSIPIIQEVVSGITWVLRLGGYPGLFGLMTVESFGIPPIPSEVILPFAGFLVAMGLMSFGGALVTAELGALLGAFLAYAVGRWGRDWITTRAPRRLRLDPELLARMDAWFARHGEAIVAVGRLIPIVTAYVSYPAGTAKMNPLKFGAFTVIGGIPYIAVLLYAGLVLRSHWNILVPYFNYADYAIVIGAAVFFVWLFLRWHRDYRLARQAPPSGGPGA